MATESRRIRIGDHVALLRVEVGPAGVGPVTITWEGEAPGRLTGAQWAQLREARQKAVAKWTSIYGVQEAQKPRTKPQAPTPRPPRDRASASVLASRRASPVQARLPLYGEGIDTLADDDPFGATP